MYGLDFCSNGSSILRPIEYAAGLVGPAVGSLHQAGPAAGDDREAGFGQELTQARRGGVHRVRLGESSRAKDAHGGSDLGERIDPGDELPFDSQDAPGFGMGEGPQLGGLGNRLGRKLPVEHPLILGTPWARRAGHRLGREQRLACRSHWRPCLCPPLASFRNSNLTQDHPSDHRPARQLCHVPSHSLNFRQSFIHPPAPQHHRSEVGRPLRRSKFTWAPTDRSTCGDNVNCRGYRRRRTDRVAKNRQWQSWRGLVRFPGSCRSTRELCVVNDTLGGSL